MKHFYLEEYQIRSELVIEEKLPEFEKLCEEVKKHFEKQWLESDNQENTAQFLKRCLIGEEVPVSRLKSDIEEYIRTNKMAVCQYPPWYQNLIEGIYHENWGLAGLAEFYTEKYKNSSSAKIIGNRIYFMEKGKMILKPQRLTKNRREQLVRSMLVNTPEERLDKDNHEIYMIDGSRIEIYNEKMTKKDQDTIIVRRYIVPDYSFEEQAARGTIPKEAIPLLKAMVKMGPNVAFTGAVRTAKTTMLSTWQSYEDPNLEGVLVETDPEIPIHLLMPTAPIIQIVADDERLAGIVKPIMRSDADYIVMAEARNGLALHIAVAFASKGTKRVKITYHTRDAMQFCYDVGAEIASYTKQNLKFTVDKVARSFDFIFHMIQLPDKSKKRLAGIYRIAREGNDFSIVPICIYHMERDDWSWYDQFDVNKNSDFEIENPEAFEEFRVLLKLLAE